MEAPCRISNYPSFIRDTCRPIEGASMEAIVDDPEVIWRFRHYRSTMEEIYQNAAKAIGATLASRPLEQAEGFSDIDIEDATGLLHLVSLFRSEPPMTADEARGFGDVVTSQWAAVVAQENVPDYCDTILPLPPTQD